METPHHTPQYRHLRPLIAQAVGTVQELLRDERICYGDGADQAAERDRVKEGESEEVGEGNTEGEGVGVGE